MKKVNFSKIKIKNFLSIGNDPVELDFTPGIHIVTGINQDEVGRRNAVGKTSLIESIYFAIFGSTLRDIKKDEEILGDYGEMYGKTLSWAEQRLEIINQTEDDWETLLETNIYNLGILRGKR